MKKPIPLIIALPLLAACGAESAALPAKGG